VVQVNDGAKVVVDGEVLIDKFTNSRSQGGLSTFKGTTSKALSKYRMYEIIIEYRENEGDAGMVLQWSSKSQTLQTVPSDRLFHRKLNSVEKGVYDTRYVGILPTEPNNVRLTIDTQHSLLTEWDQVTNDGGAPVTSYVVEWYSKQGTSAVYTLTAAATAKDGTFRLSLAGEETPPLPYDINFLDLEFYLERLSTAGDVLTKEIKTKGKVTSWEITFLTRVKPLAGNDFKLVSVDLSPPSASMSLKNKVAATAYERYGKWIVYGAPLDKESKSIQYLIPNLEQGIKYGVRVRATGCDSLYCCGHIYATEGILGAT
jgi:hypothetical protein